MFIKITGILLYLIVVVVSIFSANYIIGLTAFEAFSILIAALLLLFITLYLTSKLSRLRKRRFKADVYPHNTRHRSNIFFFKRILFFIISAVLLFTCIKIKDTVDATDIPDYLAAFKEKYSEASDFVNAYPQNKNKHYTIDLKNEVTKGTIPLFIQWDKRWGYEKYGNELIGTAGCGPTCLSMLICGLTGNTEADPLTVANFSEEQEYYVSGEGTSWNLMTEGAQSWGLDVEAGTVTEEYILEHLTEDTPMICSMYPGDFTYTGHFIVLTGIDSSGCIIIHDPNSYTNSETHWSLERILPQIRAIWTYRLDAD